jgi:hypothetical protein
MEQKFKEPNLCVHFTLGNRDGLWVHRRERIHSCDSRYVSFVLDMNSNRIRFLM